MTTDTRTENDTVAEVARIATEPHDLQLGGYYVVQTPDGHSTVDLTGDQWRDLPRRKVGTVVVHDVAGFAHYYGRHADGDTEVYADLDTGVITAVLDAHEAGGRPRWEEHRLQLRLKHTEQWMRWTSKNRYLLPQVQFAEFLEDNLVDIAAEPVPAATMLQVASTFQALTKGTFTSKANLTSGARTLFFEETTDATSGTGKQQVPVPEKFAVLLAPFDDVDLYRIEARLRYRIEDSQLKLCFVLDRPEDSLRDAVKSVVDKVAEQTGATIMRGAPA
jgi:uncharacterized protein YfdQ (DUF2303 family)